MWKCTESEVCDDVGRGRVRAQKELTEARPQRERESCVEENFCIQVFFDYDPSSSASLLSSVGVTTRPYACLVATCGGVIFMALPLLKFPFCHVCGQSSERSLIFT